jgi:hypothetical protein
MPPISLLVKVLRRLATTPERAKLVEKAIPTLEKLITEQQPERVYLHGSYAGAKPNPSDVDVIFKHKKQNYTKSNPVDFTKQQEQVDPIDVFNAKPTKGKTTWEQYPEYKTNELKLSKYTPGEWDEQLRDELRRIVVEGKSRYGSDYKWIRLLGLTPLASGLVNMEE